MDSLVAHIVEKILNLVDLLQLVCNNISRTMEEIAKKLQQKGYRFTRKTNGMFEVTERIIIAGDDLPKDPREIS